MATDISMPGPDTVILTAARRRLRLVWADRDAIELPAQQLRNACRCAACVRARHDQTPPQADPGIEIASLAPIGDYGLNITYSDGHHRGIYPWVYLGALARQLRIDAPPLADD